MNSRPVIVFLTLLLVSFGSAQVRDEMLLKRADQGKEGINPEEIVNFKSDVNVGQALTSLSELAKKLTGKPIIFDPQYFKDKTIGVDIVQMPWKTAMETILRASGVWYQEQQDYFQLVAVQGGVPQTPSGTQQTTQQGLQQGMMPTGMAPFDSTEMIARSREVTISAIFLEINTNKLRESGVNFSIFRTSTSDLNLGVEFKGAGPNTGTGGVSSDIFGITASTSPGQLTVDVETALKIFESNSLGEIIARPTVTVRSGFPGRMQVGEDFSVKQRTISGDVTEVFYSTGSILEVTPKVYRYNNLDFIDVQVSVERSSLIDPATSRINKTQGKSKLLLLNGEENYLGGLFLTEETQVREGIPLLKDLPWWVFGLRYIFGYDRVQTSKKELIVILRAELLPTLEERVSQKQKNVLDEKLKEGRNDVKKRTQIDKN